MANHRKNSRRKAKRSRSLIKFVEVLFLLFELMGFPKHFSKYSKKTFNNWQLFAMLVLRAKSTLSVEEFIEQLLPSADCLVKALELTVIPTASTLRKFARQMNLPAASCGVSR